MFSTRVDFEWVQGQSAQPEWIEASGALWERGAAAALPRWGHVLHGQPEAAAANGADRHGSRALVLGAQWVVVPLRLLLTLCALALCGSGASMASEEQRAARMRRELSVTVAKDVQVWRDGDEKAYAALLDERADPSWRRDLDRTWRRTLARDGEIPQTQVAQITPQGDYTLVALDLAQSNSRWGSTVYRQYRFYRLVDGRWLRTFPTDSFWGETQMLETPHIRFEFREWDTPVVNDTAVRLERIYTRLYKIVDIPTPLAADKLTLSVAPRASGSWSMEGRQIRVPSYISVSTEPGLSEADVFVQTVTSGLTYQVLRDVRAPQGWTYSSLWNAIFPGLHSWLMASASQQPVLWDARAEALLQQQLAAHGPLRLVNLSYMPLPTEQAEEWLWRMKAGEAMMDYIVLTYGEKKIPPFIKGLSTYSSWATLVPGLFDVPLAEFEADWNRYLAGRFLGDEQFHTAAHKPNP